MSAFVVHPTRSVSATVTVQLAQLTLNVLGQALCSRYLVIGRLPPRLFKYTVVRYSRLRVSMLTSPTCANQDTRTPCVVTASCQNTAC